MKYILTLKSDVFLWINNKEGLLYNCSTFKYLQFLLTPSIEKMCVYLNNIDNLYSIEYDDKEADNSLLEFVQNIVYKEFATLHNNQNSITVSLPPVLHIRNNWERIVKENSQCHSKILDYLSVVTIFMGGHNIDEAKLFLQTEYPISGDETIDFYELSLFLRRLLDTNVKSIRFVISNLKNYPNLADILQIIASLGNKATLFIKAEELLAPMVSTLIKQNEISTVLLYRTSRYINKFIKLEKVYHRYLVDNEKDLFVCSKFTEDTNIVNYDIIPVFTGDNQNFIFKYAFLTKEEIFQTKLNKRHLFMHQAVNVLSFGHFFILPSGKVYTDLNKENVGYINDEIHSLILAELNINNSWRRTRRINGCANCILVDICPSPTRLEDIIGATCICTNISK